MGWAVGYDSKNQRDIGYGVPACCDHPDCTQEIHRGLSYVCGGRPFGGKQGCGLFFCIKHLNLGSGPQKCDACFYDLDTYSAKQDLIKWIYWKLHHSSWHQWRSENPAAVLLLKSRIDMASPQEIEEVKNLFSSQEEADSVKRFRAQEKLNK